VDKFVAKISAPGYAEQQTKDKFSAIKGEQMSEVN